jgi:hypothetical protein
MSISRDSEAGYWQQLVLEGGGFTPVLAATAAAATPQVHAGGIDAIVLGRGVAAEERTFFSRLGFTGQIPVICMCGLQGNHESPVEHVSPSRPAELLRMLDRVLGKQDACCAAVA